MAVTDADTSVKLTFIMFVTFVCITFIRITVVKNVYDGYVNNRLADSTACYILLLTVAQSFT